MENWHNDDQVTVGDITVHEHYWREMVTIETESNSRGTNVRIRVNAQTPDRAIDLYREARRKAADLA